MDAKDAAARIAAQFSGQEFKAVEFRGEVSVEFDRKLLIEVGRFCRDSLGFDYLVDVSGVDNLSNELEALGRFEVVYGLYSYSHHISLRLRVRVPEENPVVASVAGLWRTADWHEREIYDMMGVKFEGHPDLRRILMWEGYPYFPLRKDFPLAGKPTEIPDVAFSAAAPLAGGPFVTEPAAHTHDREPRAKTFGED
ncbi:MAG: NADH-quinone oxidoreductase subunit C [Verrucomicrobiae bacterium]|nr:NADH-quinone oxidoreductase subunit C [Verrucomicrobiae bacterium]